MSIASMYHQPNLFESILAALEKAGVPKEQVTRKDLARFDEFHVGGQRATLQMAADAGLQKGMQVLDLGCGLGGPARLLADEYGCQVTGIDLTPEYVRTAQQLSALTAHSINFVQGDVLDLPFSNHSFDVVWTQHVQMNIQNKKQFYSEAARVLKAGGRLVYYDVLKQGNDPIQYPVPWASDGSMSFLITPAELHALLQQTGFIKRHTQTVAPPPPRGSTLLIDEERLQNLYTNFANKTILLESGLFIKPS